MTERLPTPDTFVVDECDVSKTGHCALHGIEIERRKSTQKDLSDLKTEVEALKIVVTILSSFRDSLNGGIKWGSVFAVIIVMGSYTYCYNHIQDSDRDRDRIESKIALADSERKGLSNTINSIKVEQGRNDERASGINARLSSIDGRLAQMIGLMMNSGKIKTEDVMEMYQNPEKSK